MKVHSPTISVFVVPSETEVIRSGPPIWDTPPFRPPVWVGGLTDAALRQGYRLYSYGDAMLIL